MSSSKFPESCYSNIPSELLARYAIHLVDEIPLPYLTDNCHYEWQVYQAVVQLRYQTVHAYRSQLKRGIECDMFMHYLHNFSLAKESLLYEAVVGEIKVRKLASIL